MTSGSRAVFLSYASEDAEAAARVAEALRKAGVEVWFDRDELRGGDAWDQKIRLQIRTCGLFLPIISAHSEARLEGYFRREWKLAVDRTDDMASEVPFLVPIVVDETPNASAHVPERFRHVQWTRLRDGVPAPDFVELIGRLVTPTSSGGVAPSRPKARGATGPEFQSAPGQRVRPWSRILLISAAVVGATAAYVAYHRVSRTGLAQAPSTIAEAANRTIAVLPFVDMSEKHDQQYFADGMAEETLNQLSKVPGLKVIGRTSSFQLRGKSDDLRNIGEVLGAAYVLEGSVRRMGPRIRVTAQLISTQDGAHRWSENYERDASDALGVQDAIAAGLTRALQLEVTSHPRRGPRSQEAYEAYLRGLHAREAYDQTGFDQAEAEFRRALALDPAYAPAAEALARTLFNQVTWAFVKSRDGVPAARKAAENAIALDEHSGIAHGILGAIHVWYDWDWEAAEREMRAAMRWAPGDPVVLMYASELHTALGEWDEAMRLHRDALSLDPLMASLHQDTAWTLMRMGRFEEAEAFLRSALKISPTYVGAHHDLGVVLILEGKPEAALAQMQQESPKGGRAAGLVIAYHALRRTDEADAEAKKLLEEAAILPYFAAEAFAFQSQTAAAFELLDSAVSQKDVFLWLIKGNPLFKGIEADSRYSLLMRRLNLPSGPTP